MKQKENKRSAKNAIPESVYTNPFSNNPVNEPLIKETESMRENGIIKKAEELLAPYYDEFHFANYE